MISIAPGSKYDDDETLTTECISPAMMCLGSVEPLSPAIKRAASSTKRGRSVRFASSFDLTEERLSSVELTEKEVEALWFSKAEFRLMQKSYAFIVRLIEYNQGLEDDEMCSRGLETKTRLGMRRRKQQIEVAVDAVLFEQEKQWKENIYSTRRLAEVYRPYTAQCSMTAYLVAQKDAQETKNQNIPRKVKSLNPQRLAKRPDTLRSQSSVRSNCWRTPAPHKSLTS
jgi:hypothetical protein